ncbi:hypothetical protein LOC51_39450 [Rubrivivax sp. JA1024]|nr:hypothetical protein [Rubrivivax sp. JA1024]
MSRTKNRWVRIAMGIALAWPVLAAAYGPMYNIGNLGVLDSSWYYQSIQYRIVENARERHAGRKPAEAPPPAGREALAGLLTAPDGTTRVPARLAAAYPPAGRSQAESTFATLLRSYGDIERRFGIEAGDLGGAAAAFVAGCWMAMHGADFPDRHFATLVAQMRQVMASQPGFAAVPARERREAYEQLAIIGMFMATTQMGLKARPDPALARSSRDAARRYLAGFLKGDVDRLTLSDDGLRLR